MRPGGPCRTIPSCPGRSQDADRALRRDDSGAGLRGGRRLGQDRLGRRDRQRAHPAPGVLLGAAAGECALVEPERDGTGGRPVAAAADMARGPAEGGLQASLCRLRLPMPGLLFVCSPGRAPWVYAAASRPTDPEQQLFRSPTFNTFGDGRVCTGSHTFPEALNEIPESFFESYFSMTGDVRNRSKKHPDDHTNYGRSLMALLSTQLRTWFHSVPWPRSWRSQPRRRWSGWWGRAPRRARRNSTTWRRHEVLRPGLGPHSEKKQGDEKRCLTREETP